MTRPPIPPESFDGDERPILPEPVRTQLREIARVDPPDDLYRAVLQAVDATPQRRRRLFAVPDWLLVTAVTAVVIAVGVGLSIRSAPGPGGEMTASPSSSASPAAPSASADPGRYESEHLPWAIDLPDGWRPYTVRADELGSYETFNRFQPSLVTVGVGSTPVPDGRTGEDFLEEALGTDEACPESPVERTDTTMGGEPAVLITYECQSRFLGLLVTIHNDRRYIMGFDADDSAGRAAAIDELIPAFEFTD